MHRMMKRSQDGKQTWEAVETAAGIEAAAENLGVLLA
jgi:hypothetical protein